MGLLCLQTHLERLQRPSEAVASCSLSTGAGWGRRTWLSQCCIPRQIRHHRAPVPFLCCPPQSLPFPWVGRVSGAATGLPEPHQIPNPHCNQRLASQQDPEVGQHMGRHRPRLHPAPCEGFSGSRPSPEADFPRLRGTRPAAAAHWPDKLRRGSGHLRSIAWLQATPRARDEASSCVPGRFPGTPALPAPRGARQGRGPQLQQPPPAPRSPLRPRAAAKRPEEEPQSNPAQSAGKNYTFNSSKPGRESVGVFHSMVQLKRPNHIFLLVGAQPGGKYTRTNPNQATDPEENTF